MLSIEKRNQVAELVGAGDEFHSILDRLLRDNGHDVQRTVGAVLDLGGWNHLVAQSKEKQTQQSDPLDEGVQHANALGRLKDMLDFLDDESDQELQGLLALYGGNVQSASTHYLSWGFGDRDGLLPNSSTAAKRSRTSEEGSSKEPSIEPPVEPMEMELGANMMHGVNTMYGVNMSNTVLTHQLASMGTAIAGLTKELKQLRTSIAPSVVKAVREYDEDQATAEAYDDQYGRLRTIHRTIRMAGSFANLGKIEGFHINIAENLLICDDCHRYASFAPGALRRGVKDAGVIQGPNMGREYPKVVFQAKAHVACGLHEWCVMHASEVRRLGSEEAQVALTVGLQVRMRPPASRILRMHHTRKNLHNSLVAGALSPYRIRFR